MASDRSPSAVVARGRGNAKILLRRTDQRQTPRVSDHLEERAECRKQLSIFCYDLMNEPVVPGDKKRDDWLGGAFGGKHFVQFITLSAAGRPRHEIAKKWTNQLVAAIRKHDRRHLVTVGLVPWSLDRPGLTSGFIPEKVTGNLDFIAMHIYPESGRADKAVETLKGFAAVGKPVVIEEIFPLKCDAKELGQFIDVSRKHATGWIGFYWGKTPDEYRPPKTIREAIVLSWLELFQEKGKTLLEQSPFGGVDCEGTYRYHIQGISRASARMKRMQSTGASRRRS